MQPCKVRHDGTDGWFVPWDHPVASIFRAKMTNGKYPDVFEEFWTIYPKDRRGAKGEAYEEWINLPHEDRGKLVKATEAYRDYILVESELKWMKIAKNYLSSKLYENYLDRESQSNTIGCLTYWDNAVVGVAGFAPAWKADDRSLAVEDVRRLSPHIWNEKVWVFFSGRDPMIEEQKKKLGLHYKTFHGMLTKELMTTRVKKPTPCDYCGELGGRHDPGCPIVVQKNSDTEKYKAEIAKGKEVGFDFKAAFNKEVGRG